jgi:hypothetical protein
MLPSAATVFRKMPWPPGCRAKLDRLRSGIYYEIGLIVGSFQPCRLPESGRRTRRLPSKVRPERANSRALTPARNKPVILYILGALALAVIVFAFLSAKTWHWGYVLVVVGIFFSTLGYFILAAEVLRINAVLLKLVNDLETNLTRIEAQNVAL